MTGHESIDDDEGSIRDPDKISEEELRRAILKRRLKTGLKWSWKQYAWTSAFFYIFGIVLLFLIGFEENWRGQPYYKNVEFPWIVGAVAIGSPLFAAFIQFYVSALQRIAIAMNAVSIGVVDASEKASQLQDNLGDDFVTNLVKINFKYIDQYYLQTQQQANRSFSLSMWVSVAGFVILSIGIMLAIFKGDAPAYVATAAGVLSEFIAAVFFYLYNRTILSMGNYHRKLVITQNIALALKISEGLPDPQRADTQVELVKTLSADVNNLLTLEGGLKAGA